LRVMEINDSHFTLYITDRCAVSSFNGSNHFGVTRMLSSVYEVVVQVLNTLGPGGPVYTLMWSRFYASTLAWVSL
jgi:hypothetical protein